MAPAAVLQVFGQPASTDVARVLACLFERNLDFELVRTDAFKRAHKLPDFVKTRDPSGQVTFKHGDTTLTDSRDICRYMCIEFPRVCTKALYGAGALERASIDKWLQVEAQSFDAPSSELAFHLAFEPRLAGVAPATPDDEARVAESQRRLLRVLGVYDDALARTRFLAGDEFTLADLSHLPNLHYIAGSERGRRLLGAKKHVARWHEDISARTAWRQVVAVQSAHPAGTFVP